MSTRIMEWLNRNRYLIPASGRVLELGSLNVNGTPRPVFGDATEYIGIDFRDGKDVDRVMNAHDVGRHFKAKSFDTVINMNLLEHDDEFWKTIEAENKVLKSGGYLVFCIPTYDFPIHRHPKDYFRFLDDAIYEVVFKGYAVLNMEKVNTKFRDDDPTKEPINHVLCAIGRKL